jgi:endopolyphosphatase
MQLFTGLLFLSFLQFGYAWPFHGSQTILGDSSVDHEVLPLKSAPRKLHGRFLHITGKPRVLPYSLQPTYKTTDLHPDPFYKVHSSTEEEAACHRGIGPAGTYGAETSDCDSPFTLVNQTFKWIENNLRDTVDFVVWTGDSARHDNDENIPRSEVQVLGLNEYIAGKFVEVFGNVKDEPDGIDNLAIPIVPTLGNNDILPHNILLAGPNKWLKNYAKLWRNFIPEEQRHSFEHGGWFYVEVIPQKLAVFSLNTLYFFDNNSAVDGCAAKSEPGWEHMEWLRIQLQFIRERGMKAILIGHVPPARTESKQLWDETCWQKYTLWLKQYRDVVIGGIYGHMNIDHFMLQDTEDIYVEIPATLESLGPHSRDHLDDELTINSAADYLEELRDRWSELPDPSSALTNDALTESSPRRKEGKRDRKPKKNKGTKNFGGRWGERFQVTHVGPSVVPNFFPTLRVIEYNVTGLEGTPTWLDLPSDASQLPSLDRYDLQQGFVDLDPTSEEPDMVGNIPTDEENIPEGKSKKNKKGKKKKGKKKKGKTPKIPDLIVPPPPSKSSPPGPAYSPQTLTLLGYTQYFANLTHINNETFAFGGQDVTTDGWHEGKHSGKRPKKHKSLPKEFEYEVEYNTFHDPDFDLKDMTVPSYLKLAHRIGQYKPPKGDEVRSYSEDKEPANVGITEEGGRPSRGKCSTIRWRLPAIFNRAIGVFWDYGMLAKDWLRWSRTIEVEQDIETEKKRNNHKRESGHKKRNKNRAWLAFIRRAFVDTMDQDEILNFQVTREQGSGDNVQGEL